MLEHLIKELAPGQLDKRVVIVGPPHQSARTFPNLYKATSTHKIDAPTSSSKKYLGKYELVLADYSNSVFSYKQLNQLVGVARESGSSLLFIFDNPARHAMSGDRSSNKAMSLPEIVAFVKEKGFRVADPYYILKGHGVPDTIFSEAAVEKGITIPLSYADTAVLEGKPSLSDPLKTGLFAGKDPSLYRLLANKVVLFASTKKISNSLIYLKLTSSRKDVFSIYTSVHVSADGIVAKKSATNDLAIPHVNQFIKRHQVLDSILKPPVYAAGVKKVSDGNVIFPFIEGENLYTKMSEYIVGEEFEEFYTSFNKYLRLFDAFSSLTRNPHDSPAYTSVFGTGYDSVQKCISPGLIDVNFDNLVVNEDHVTIIDYEWFFDFPVPQKYLITRALYYFFFAHQQKIYEFATKKGDVTQITEQVYVPSVIYKRLSDYFTDMESFLVAEKGFQNYALRRSSESGNDKADYTPSPPPSPNVLLSEYIEQLLRELDTACKESGAAQAQLNQILNSKRWKLSSRVASLYHSAKRRK